MAVQSFNRKKAKEASQFPAGEEGVTAAVAERPKQEVTKAQPPASGQLEGDWNRQDIQMPYLSLCQKSGNLFDENPDFLGSYVYDKRAALGKEIRFVALAMRKSYEEKIEYGSDEMPARWDTAQEAKATGLPYREVATVDILIETKAKELENDTIFPGWIPARWVVRSTAYSKVAKVIFSDLSKWLKGNMRSGVYVASVAKATDGKNTWFVPILKAGGATPKGVAEQIEEHFPS